MFTRAVKLIGSEWKLSLFFVFIILLLGSLSLFFLKGTIFKIILFCIGLDVYNGYFLAIGKILKGEALENPYKFILFGKDKNRYDFVILLVLFCAILLLLKGPMVLFQVLLSEKLNQLLASVGQWVIVYNMLMLLGYTAYKVSLFSAIASITYHRIEVLEAFKAGIKGIWTFKVILIVLLLFEIVVSFLVATSNVAILNGVTLIFYIIPAMLMFLMSCSYSLADAAIVPEAGYNDKQDKETSMPNQGH